jgi:hypothetical protein
MSKSFFRASSEGDRSGNTVFTVDSMSLRSDFWIGNFGDGNNKALDSTRTQVGQPTDKSGKLRDFDVLSALFSGNGSHSA